ncbi:MAG: 3-methyl-2-oxobutanoate hydroxymethyltransferase, partial [Pseudomonadota bacterium]
MNILDWQKKKKAKELISMVTCYDYWSARVLAKSKIDALLVGDSLAMVMYGHPNTLAADIPLMAQHTLAVKRGAPGKFVVADMPFLSFRKGIKSTMDAVEALMRAQANAVKIEGVLGHEKVISHIVQSGVPVMGHLGLIPQSIHQLGGYRVQGKKANNAPLLIDQAKCLEDLGVFALVLECLDEETANEISQSLSIPTIGIGAGRGADGQILVLHDLLGADPDFNPKYLKKFAQLDTV